MGKTCSQHPDRASEGVCLHCGGDTCAMCKVDIDGRIFCSVTCFTEQTLATKRKTLRDSPQQDPSSVQIPGVDPLADVDFSQPGDPAAALNDPSIILGADQAQKRDDSSILVRDPNDPDASETSILDMGDLKKGEGVGSLPEESSVLDIDALKKDHTSILGMEAIHKPEGAAEKMPYVIPVPKAPEADAGLPSWMDEPQQPAPAPQGPPSQAETPLTLVIPGTARSTIQSTCVFHPDTQAVVLCQRCGDAICTMCVSDEAHGGHCSPQCRRDAAKKTRSHVIRGGLVAAAALLIFVGVWAMGSKKETTAPAAKEVPSSGPTARELEELEAKAKAEEFAKNLERAKATLAAEAAAKEAERAKAEEARAKAKAEADAVAKVEEQRKADAAKRIEDQRKAELAKAEALKKAEEAKKAEELAKAEALKKEEEKKKAAMAAEAAAKAAALKKAEDAKKAEELAKAEAVAKAEAAAKAEALRKVEEQKKVDALAAEAAATAAAMEKARLEAVAKDLATAALLIREAKPLFEQFAERIGDARAGSDRDALLATATGVRAKLREARSIYLETVGRAPNPQLLVTRVQVLDGLIEILDAELKPAAAKR
jgi:hypothetical protein